MAWLSYGHAVCNDWCTVHDFTMCLKLLKIYLNIKLWQLVYSSECLQYSIDVSNIRWLWLIRYMRNQYLVPRVQLRERSPPKPSVLGKSLKLIWSDSLESKRGTLKWQRQSKFDDPPRAKTLQLKHSLYILSLFALHQWLTVSLTYWAAKADSREIRATLWRHPIFNQMSKWDFP